MFVPAMLPMAMEALPSVAAVIPTASSGILVPKDTMVRPMIMGFIPISTAKRVAPRNNSSAPSMMMTNPARNITKGGRFIYRLWLEKVKNK